MAFNPIPIPALVPGLAGNSARFGQALDNADAAYTEYGPSLINCATKWNTDADTDVLMGEWIVPKNEDNIRVAVDIWWRGASGHTATATLSVGDGVGADTDTATRTSSSFAHSTLDVLPNASSGHPRFASLFLRTSTAGQRAEIASMCSYFLPSGYATGVNPSGAAKLGAWDVADRAVPSEVIGRLQNNIISVAKDRPCGLAGGMHANFSSSLIGAPAGPDYSVTGAIWQTVDRFIVPPHDSGARRRYRLAVKATGDDPEWRINIGGYVWQGTGTGWSFDLPKLVLPEGTFGSVSLRSATNGDCHINTWQLLREPE